MNISFEKQDLEYVADLAQQISKENSPVPILSCLLIEATEDGVSISASNMEVTLKSKIQATVDEPGTITVPAKRFFNVIQNLSNDHAVHIIGQGNNRVLIKSGKSQYRMIGQIADEFPKMKEFNEEKNADNVITLDAHQFRTGVDQTAFAASTDNNEILHSVHFNLNDERTDIVATDRYMLSLVMVIPENSSKLSGEKLTIPQSSVKYIRKVFASSYTITILIDEKQILFTDSSNTVTARVLGAEYANYQQLMQFEDLPGSAIVDRKSFIEVVKRINVMSTLLKGNVAILNMKTIDGEGQLHISAKASEHGDAEDILTLTDLTINTEIAVDGTNLLRILSAMRSENIKLRFKDKSSAMYLQAIGDDLQNDHICLIMPIQL